uniref:Uncharacterized protein n=1 Tax=Pithovirus LCPAC403 TaxID=2506596 RepID=A0A481ZBT1_9VIRU|nr:MAG: uncharacterized protein LCPAC403_02400 [Pithovirus LCPAC403]
MSPFVLVVLIIIAILLIVQAAIAINLFNRLNQGGTDQTSKGEQVTSIIFLVIGIILILAAPLWYFWSSTAKTT